MRLAWFSPWPPDPSGVAGRSAELVPALAAAAHGVDVLVDETRHGPQPPQADTGPEPGRVRVLGAHDFVWRVARGQYDLVVYQLGNSVLHEYIWPYCLRWPGLAVLHDARLYHARARAYLGRGEIARFRAAFAWSHPDVQPEAAELAVSGFDGTYYYLWPMVRDVIATARFIAVHSPGAAAALRDEFPDRPIGAVTLGEGPDIPMDGPARDAARRELGLSPDSVAFGVFGALTFEKRLPQVFRAFRAALAVEPNARLVLCGAPGAGIDIQALARSFGVDRSVTLAGVLDNDAFDRAIGAVDVSINLRWPTALETSGPWLRALAAGKATVIVNLAHQIGVPTLDPRTWQRPGRHPREDAIAIGIDILDEDHSLALALGRLATDQPLRDRLGSQARSYWQARHTFARMRDEYLELLERAERTPPPASPRPPAVEYDPAAYARALVADFGDLACRLF